MNMIILTFTFVLGSYPVQETVAEQADIMAAESIAWDCTTDGECFVECVAQGMPEPLCEAWSYNSAGYLGQPPDRQAERPCQGSKDAGLWTR